jgi:hypothetical protein
METVSVSLAGLGRFFAFPALAARRAGLFSFAPAALVCVMSIDKVVEGQETWHATSLRWILILLNVFCRGRDPSFYSGLKAKHKQKEKHKSKKASPGRSYFTNSPDCSKRTACGYPMAALLVSRDANPLITFASGLLEG